MSWEVAEPDTPLDQVFVQVAYARMLAWLGTDRRGCTGDDQSIAFDSTQIQKSDAQGVLRVFAADGLNTVSPDVRTSRRPRRH